MLYGSNHIQHFCILESTFQLRIFSYYLRDLVHVLLKIMCMTFYFADLFHKAGDENAKRDYLYYLAVGHTRLKVIFENQIIAQAFAELSSY